MSTSKKKLPHAPVAVAPKEGHAAWVIERERLSAPGDETEAETLDVAEERLLKLLDTHTERELPC
jgi:pyruvate/2-oxoacid:ferredoxin oxidoreductase alpha subunit